MKIACLDCRQNLQVEDELMGQNINCPSCKKIIQIPKKSKDPDKYNPRGMVKLGFLILLILAGIVIAPYILKVFLEGEKFDVRVFLSLIAIIIFGFLFILVVRLLPLNLYIKKSLKREIDLRKIAKKMNFEFFNYDDVNDYYIWKNMEKLLTFNLRYSISQELTNMLLGLNSDTIISIVDFRYQYTVVSNGNSHQSGGKYSEATLIYIESKDLKTPHFMLNPENWFNRFLSGEDINFERFPEFSKKFLLRGYDRNQIQNFLNTELIELLEEKDNINIECFGNRFIFFRSGKLVSPKKIETFLDEGLVLLNALINASRNRKNIPPIITEQEKPNLPPIIQ